MLKIAAPVLHNHIGLHSAPTFLLVLPFTTPLQKDLDPYLLPKIRTSQITLGIRGKKILHTIRVLANTNNLRARVHAYSS